MKNNTEEYISEKIIQRICECGWNAYLCGGAVRDEFLDTEPSDYDITTDALPEELEQIFPDKNVKTFGVSFLVTTIDNIDVATYRSERNSGPGRFNCITKACQTLDEDLARRDFTFNAIAICPYTGEIVDPFNGKKDLENRVVRFVGDGNERIYEDPLRMLRAARFTCLIEGNLDITSFQAICNNKDMVKDISPERIRIELIKVMKYKTPSIFFDVLYDTGILKILFPELEAMYGHTGGKYHGETLDQHFKLTGDKLSYKDPILRLTGYLHDIGKPVVYDGENFIDHEKVGSEIVESLLTFYKFSKQESSKITNLTLTHMRSIKGLKIKGYRKLLKKFNELDINWRDWFKLKIADNKSNLLTSAYSKEEIKAICLGIYKASHESKSGGFQITDLEINGNDIMMELNIKPGPKIGIILKYLLEYILNDPELNTKENLIKLVKETSWDQL